jgi:LPXTG-motif cell wall-anchored protein
MKKLFLLFFIFSFKVFANSTDSIKVENIDIRLTGAKMYIEYDLLGPKDEELNLKIELRRESVPSFVYVPVNVGGDIGNGKFYGSRRQIIWNFVSEFPNKLTGRDYYVVVKAKLIRSGSNALLWIGGGAAILSGGAYLFFSKKKTETQQIYLPDPPDRP